MDFIALSFVREARDLLQLRELFPEDKPHPLVIAKIEDQQAIKNLESIVQEADAIMVARGDLGIEIPLTRNCRLSSAGSSKRACGWAAR